MKICRKCTTPKPVEEFQIDRRLKSGRTSLCKPCASDYANDWHRANREHHNQKMTSWRRAQRHTNPEKFLLTSARRRARETNRPFALKLSDMVMPEICPALKKPLTFGTGKCHPFSPSVDSIRPELGYVPGNIAVISLKANSIKQNATPEELRQVADWLEKMLQSEAPSLAETDKPILR